MLRKQSRAQLDRLEGMTYTDMRGVRSDNPPRRSSVSDRPPSAAIQRAIAEKVEAILATQETDVRQNFGKMHAALEQALPLGKVLDELPAAPAAEPKE